jgi:hypothetical protein
LMKRKVSACTFVSLSVSSINGMWLAMFGSLRCSACDGMGGHAVYERAESARIDRCLSPAASRRCRCSRDRDIGSGAGHVGS